MLLFSVNVGIHASHLIRLYSFTFEPVREKTKNLWFRPGPTQTGLHSNRRQLDAP